MSDDLTQQLHSLAVALDEFTPPVTVNESAPTTEATFIEVPRSRHRRVLVAAACIVLVVGTIVGTWWIASRSPAVTPAAPTTVDTPTTSKVPTTTSDVPDDPAGALGPDGMVIVAANPPGFNGMSGDLYGLVPGQAPRLLVGAPGDGLAQQCPRLSEDGRYLAWGESTATGVQRLRTPWPVEDRVVVVAPITLSGSVLDAVVRVPIPDGNGEMACPEWAPDSSAVAYRVDGDVWITHLDGSTSVVLADEPTWPAAELAWSRDGSRIAVSESGRLRIIDATTTSSYTIELGADHTPAALNWLPGDQRILFGSSGNPVDQVITDLAVVSVNAPYEQTSIVDAVLVPNKYHEFVSPTLSPDGNELAVVHQPRSCFEGGGCMSETTELLLVDLDTNAIASVATPMTYVGSVTWSPAGDRLLVASIDGVLSIPPSGGGETVTYVDGADLNLEWFNNEITWLLH
jgi:hypothetical protein